MNKKGFTLIELLAVIVILAVLMVIAVPKILDVIQNSRKSAAKSSAELYIDAIEKNNAISNVDSNASKIADGQNMDTRLLNVKVKGTKPKYGTISIEKGKVTNANLCIDGYNVVFENRNATVLEEPCDMENIPEYALFDGNGVDSPAPIMKNAGEKLGTLQVLTREGYEFLGWFTLKEGGDKITEETVMPLGGATYYAQWKQNIPLCQRATTLHEEICERTSGGCYARGYTSDNKGTTIVYGNDPTTRKENVLEPGDAFDCDVDGSGKFEDDERFYYVSDYYDTKKLSFDNTKATLIYYNNTKDGEPNNTAKIARGGNANGPSSVSISYLPKNDIWLNVDINTTRTILSGNQKNIKSDFIYNGSAARFLTFQELVSACGDQPQSWGNDGLIKCEYLLENTNYIKTNLASYFLETTLDDSRHHYVIDGIQNRIFYGYYEYDYYNSSSNVIGVRPVIEVDKTKISY